MVPDLDKKRRMPPTTNSRIHVTEPETMITSYFSQCFESTSFAKSVLELRKMSRLYQFLADHVEKQVAMRSTACVMGDHLSVRLRMYNRANRIPSTDATGCEQGGT